MPGLPSTAPLPGWIPGFLLWFLRSRRSSGHFATATGHHHAEPCSGAALNRNAFDYDDLGQLERDAQVQILTDVSSENRGGAHGGARRSWEVQKVHSVSLRSNQNEKSGFCYELRPCDGWGCVARLKAVEGMASTKAQA